MDAYEAPRSLAIALAAGLARPMQRHSPSRNKGRCVMTNFEATIPQPPRLRPTWTTWMWIGFMVAVVVLTTIGLWPNGVY
jgi:hypothetical protein